MNRSALDVKSIFGQAIVIPEPFAREEFLAAACRDAPEVRAQVLGLLDALQHAGSFMRSPAAPPAGTQDYEPAESEGDVIGPYTLREQIGEGGFGLVFVAEQQHPVRRKVALKLIKPGMDSRAVVARFEAERQALALMDHPNIAKVLDAGAAESGKPYFVMELVKGMPITEYADAHNLTPRERLELFVLVCQAVQHAHQKGVIHRDIKPSNVLVTVVDGVAIPKVIDFGVAKAVGQQLTEKTVYTRFASMVGTPLYMSPEQAELSGVDVDTRSDVYALGVLLYELLTGTTPFDGERFKKAAFDEIRRIIKEEEPPRPSTRLSSLGPTLTTVSARRGTEPGKLACAIRGELDWVVMKCLEKDRNRRYETATGLAKDVQRYLAGDAVEACPPTLGYRLRKAYRRNKATFVTASTVAVALLFGIGLASWQAVRATNAEHRTAAALTEAADQRDIAVTRSREADDERVKATIALKENERTQAIMSRDKYASDMQALAITWPGGNVIESRQILDRNRPKPGEAPGFEYGYWDRVTHAERRSDQLKPADLGGFSRSWAISGDASRVACVELPLESTADNLQSNMIVTVWDASSRKELWSPVPIQSMRRGFRDNYRAIADLSRDGKRLLFTEPVYDVPNDNRDRSLLLKLNRVRCVILDVESRKVLFDSEIDDKGTNFDSAMLSADGITLLTPQAVPNTNGTKSVGVKVWNLNAMKPAPITIADVTDAVLSPDGSRVVGNVGETSKVWNAATGEELHKLGTAVRWQFSGNGKVIAGIVVEEKGENPTATLQVCDAATGKELKAIRLPSVSRSQVHGSDWDLGAPRFSPDHRSVAISQSRYRSAAGRSEIKWLIVNLETGKLVVTLDESGAFASGRTSDSGFSPDAQQFMHIEDHVIAIHDAASGRVLHTLRGHEKSIAAFAPDPDGRRLWSVDVNGVLKQWDIQPNEPLRMTVSNDGRVWKGGGWWARRPTVVSADASWVAMVSTRVVKNSIEAIVEVRDAAGTSSTRLTPRPRENAMMGPIDLAISRDGRRVALARSRPVPWRSQGLDGKESPVDPNAKGYPPDVTVWDVVSGMELFYREFPETGPTADLPPLRRIVDLALSPDGRQVALGFVQLSFWGRKGGNVPNESVSVFEVDTGNLQATIPAAGAETSGLSFSPDSRRLAGFVKDGLIVWDVATSKAVFSGVQSWPSLIQVANRPAWSPDGKRLAIVQFDPTQSIRIYDAVTGILDATMNTSDRGGEFDRRTSASLIFSPDCRRVACLMNTHNSVNVVKLWDTESRKEVLTLESVLQDRDQIGPGMSVIAFTPDGLKLRQVHVISEEYEPNERDKQIGPGAIQVTTWDATPRPEPKR